MTNHATISEIISTAGSKLVSVRFIKADGSPRQLTFNPSDHNDIKGTGNPTTDPNIFRIRDIKIGQWRSFDARRCLSIKVSGQITELGQEDA
jgi:hypothetical protein